MWNWKNKPLLVTVMVVLVAEAVVIVLLPSRLPRPVRAITAGVNLIAVAGLWLARRQSSDGR
jgi:hypothetical protein